MVQQPVVSVVMATFNEPAPIISQAIRSILDQTLRALELLVIDDSTDAETVAAIDGLAQADSRIVVVRRKERIGFVPALNVGLETAKGQYIARMDGDDVALPERLATEVAFLEAHPDVSIVGSAMYIIDQDNQITSQRTYPISHRQIIHYAATRTPFAHPTVVFRRTVVDRGFRYDTHLKNCEDLDLWLRLLNNGFRGANVPEKLLKYRVVGDLGAKRNANNWRANRNVRSRNCTWKRPLWSCVSCVSGVAYWLIPKKVKSYIYGRENNTK